MIANVVQPMQHHPHRRGFSMLEVVVAMTLGMVLLAAVWTMFNLLARRQESETRQVDKNQIVRAVQQRLTRDIGNLVCQSAEGENGSIESKAIDLSVNPIMFPLIASIANENKASPRLPSEQVLVGDSNRLLLEVFVDAEEAPDLAAFVDDQNSLASFASSPAPPSKYVEYEFESQPTDAKLSRDGFESPDDLAPGPGDFGLKREEFLNGSSDSNSKTQKKNMSFDPGELDRDSEFSRFNERRLKSPAPPRKSIVREQVAEIDRLQFSYFDGESWRSSWNSGELGQLPVAVRLQFDLKSIRPAKMLSKNGDSNRADERDELPTKDFPDSADSMDEFEFEFIVLTHVVLPRRETPNRLDGKETDDDGRYNR